MEVFKVMEDMERVDNEEKMEERKKNERWRWMWKRGGRWKKLRL